MIADVHALARRELAERRIEVRTELPEDLPGVFGDRVQLQQVLLKLVMNGIEAMSGMAGELRVLTIGGQRDELADQPVVRILVQDLGSGIEPENMALYGCGREYSSRTPREPGSRPSRRIRVSVAL